MTAAIELESLRKTFKVKKPRKSGFFAGIGELFCPSYEEVTAVDDVSFSIAPGERVAFIGPNGAGKSTTLKVLSGILHANSGRVEVLGLVPWKARTALGYQIGTVFGQRSQLWYHLPPTDTFDLLARIYEIEHAEFCKRRDHLVEAFQLGPFLQKPVRQLSLGERMRCEIAASLLHRPRILFLDEPTIGLDVTAKSVVRDLVIEQSKRDGASVLLTSHDTGDMERVCDRVIVIHRGKLLLDKSVSELRALIRQKVVTLVTKEPNLRLEKPGLRVLSSAPYRSVFEVDVDITPVGAVIEAALRAATLVDITVEDPPLEEVIQAIYASADIPARQTRSASIQSSDSAQSLPT
jgi:ABC-2 type transport system ATP-binding protein